LCGQKNKKKREGWREIRGAFMGGVRLKHGVLIETKAKGKNTDRGAWCRVSQGHTAKTEKIGKNFI